MTTTTNLRRSACAALVAAALSAACGPRPEPLVLPDDPAATGVPVGVKTVITADLTMEIWYPAPDDVAGSPAEPLDLDQFISQAFRDAAGSFDTPVVDTGAVRDAPLRVPETKYPVVFFSHGFGGFRLQSFDYTIHLASRGYVVVAVDHPGRMITDLLPCMFQPPLDGCDISGLFSDPAPAQLAVAIDWVIAAAAERDGFFEDALDTTHLGMSGHSAGGMSTGTIGETDTRLSALFMMAGAADVTRVVPAAILAGTCDNVVTIDDLRAAHDASPGSQLVELVRSGHLAFANICELGLLEMADALLSGRMDVNTLFLDQLRTLGYDGCPGHEPMPPPTDCATMPYLPLETSAEIVRYYATVFFDATLRGAGPGITAGVFPDANVF